MTSPPIALDQNPAGGPRRGCRWSGVGRMPPMANDTDFRAAVTELLVRPRGSGLHGSRREASQATLASQAAEPIGRSSRCFGAIPQRAHSLGVESGAPLSEGEPPRDLRKDFDPAVRLHRQFDQLVAHTQALIRKSEQNRLAFWSRGDSSSAEKWKSTTEPMRDYIWDEVIGRLPDPSVPPNPRTRLIFDEPKFLGYEVMLDVWPGIFAYGILLVPKKFSREKGVPSSFANTGWRGGREMWRTRRSTPPSTMDSPFGWRTRALSPSRHRIRTSGRTAFARSSVRRIRSSCRYSHSSSGSISASSNGWADCPSSTGSGSVFMASRMEARRRSGSLLA